MPCSFGGRVKENLILETSALWVGFYYYLCILSEFGNLPFWDKNFPAAIDFVAELADEQPQRS
jgi:hypothetical protein